MTHPTDQLADYVDGTLAADERAVIEAHLVSCGRCRGEVALASAGRTALRMLPEAPAPDLAARFSPERVAALSSPQRTHSPPWAKVVPVLAAAAVVVLIALVLPRLGTGDDDAQTAAGDAGVEAAALGEERLRLEIDDSDYDKAATEAKATTFASRLRAGTPAADGAVDELGAPVVSADDAARYAGSAASARARRCLRLAFPEYPGRLVQIARATFEGTPAFLGTVVEGPGAGQPPDTVSVWVASVEDCSILTITSASL
ncbi:MAG: zf-HC2 domain-containing protein [Actinomycetota bacterium]